jgi:predicted transcriptional regulator
MWVKTQIGEYVNMDNALWVVTYENKILAATAYDSNLQDYVVEVLGKYVEDGAKNIQVNLMNAILANHRLFIMPQDGAAMGIVR